MFTPNSQNLLADTKKPHFRYPCARFPTFIAMVPHTNTFGRAFGHPYSCPTISGLNKYIELFALANMLCNGTEINVNIAKQFYWSFSSSFSRFPGVGWNFVLCPFRHGLAILVVSVNMLLHTYDKNTNSILCSNGQTSVAANINSAYHFSCDFCWTTITMNLIAARRIPL